MKKELFRVVENKNSKKHSVLYTDGAELDDIMSCATNYRILDRHEYTVDDYKIMIEKFLAQHRNSSQSYIVNIITDVINENLIYEGDKCVMMSSLLDKWIEHYQP